LQRLAKCPLSWFASLEGSTQQSTARERDESPANRLLSSTFAGPISGGSVVRRNSAEEIVQFLSFSSDPCDCLNALKEFSERKWEGALRWLDDAGLAFYFLQKIKNINATETLPTWVMSRLERNSAANQRRVGYMSSRFDFLNQRLNDAGVRYAVLKGLSLVPQFCPDATLRHQGDFDYLVDEQSLFTAQRVLVEAGYNPRSSRSSREFIFVMPGTEKPTRSAGQYRAEAPHAAELHLDIWDSEQHGLPLMEGLFSVQRTSTHHWNGFEFPALADEDAFLLQVLHACNHLFSYWIRMSCLFEIGHFMNRRASDTLLWTRVARRVGDNFVLRELIVVVTELVAQLFAPPIPTLVRVWGQQIRPASRVWIESYARYWAFCEVPIYEFRLFPRAKLVLFLQQQYKDARAQKRSLRDRLLPFSRFSRIASAVKDKPSLVLDASWRKRQLLVRKSLFHALAGLRYFCEIPRWLWLNRARMRSASLDM
jgi:Uncharacterised nucleotidyltransferase